MPDEPADLNTEEENARDDDWGSRILCSDESCIGVIGTDGRCKECGKAYEGKAPQAEDMNTATSDAAPQEDPVAEPATRFDDDWENRTLCSDESCIGVVGPDGRCKECGRTYEG